MEASGNELLHLDLKRGHAVVGIDHTLQLSDHDHVDSHFKFVHADLADYDMVLKVLEGCDGVIHLAACRNPGDYKVKTHNRCDSKPFFVMVHRDELL
jgi:nucleoside-diphosphate-sugar epimerase